jgi:TonB family protein
MNRAIKFSLLVAIFACLFSAGSAQNPSKAKNVQWTAINGKDNEFALYMPEGYVVGGDNNYYLGSKIGGGAHVDKQLILARYVNGVVLIMEYYDGGGKPAQKILEDREKLTLDKEEQSNGFLVKSFSGKHENRVYKTQQFLIKNRLYVVKGIAAAENDPIVRGFFESVRLTNQNNTVAPNAPAGVATTSLPQIPERETERLDDSKTFTIAEVDRKPIVLKSRRPPYPAEARRNSGSGTVKLKVLFSSSGKVTNVEVVESPSKILADASIQTVRDTLFIPAEKDGKLVSVYNFLEYHFDVR